jgi:murein DD-endopeptidase MepM/ murein hydrolase activator NlpD
MRRAWPFGLALVILGGCSEAPNIPQTHPLPEGRLSSPYGARTVDPVSGEATPNGHHDGYDLAAAMGTPIRASKAGKVTFAGRKGGYGKAVILSHAGGWSTLYGHAGRLVVKVGQEVAAGEVVAYVGSSGRSTGPHLHYELRKDGRPVDPGFFAAEAPSARAVAKRPPAIAPKAARAAETAAKPPEVEAPPLRYPADVGMPSPGPHLPEPPTRWERLKRWIWRWFRQLVP